MTSPAPEDKPDTSKPRMPMPRFGELAKGYPAGAGDMLCSAGLEELAFSGKLITMETGMRFPTDYPEGDRHFKTHREGHKFDRCRSRIALVRPTGQQLGAMDETMTRTAKQHSLPCVS